MITVFSGENDFELTKKVAQLKADFDGTAERYDAADLTKEQLADIFAGQTLFAMKRLVILDGPSGNSELWANLAGWVSRLSDDTRLVLVEPKPDKRTSSYKWLKKNAKVVEFTRWTSRDTSLAEEWVRLESKKLGFDIGHPIARLLIERIGLNQWQLFHAIQKVALLDTVNKETVTAITDARADENVFVLFETALQGDTEELHRMVQGLELTEDPYRVFGLLTSQALQLAALVFAKGSASDVAADLSASPYVLSKLSPYAARRSPQQARAIVKQFAYTDTRMKSVSANPWVLIERMLFEIARL